MNAFMSSVAISPARARSSTWSPIATPIRSFASPVRRKRPNGRFWIGKSVAGSLAAATQLDNAASCVSSSCPFIAVSSRCRATPPRSRRDGAGRAERFEQRLEIALAEAVVALALDGRRTPDKDVCEKICNRRRCLPPSVVPSSRMPRACSSSTSRRARGRSASISYRRGGAAISGTPARRKLSMLASRSSVSSAMCWMPSLLYFIRNSSIWPVDFDASFDDADLAAGAVIARDVRFVYSPLMSK
jgi:hypothetical protein